MCVLLVHLRSFDPQQGVRTCCCDPIVSCSPAEADAGQSGLAFMYYGRVASEFGLVGWAS